MFVISKDYKFSAAHQLYGLREGHQCGRLHGHNYIVRVELTGQTDDRGFVFDYGDLSPFGDWIDAVLDHRNLNDVVPTATTGEHMARWLAEVLRDVVELPHNVSVAVGVSETPTSWAWWRP